MLVTDLRDEAPRIEAARTTGTRIGEGLGEAGALGEEPMARTLAALRDYAVNVRELGIPMRVIATSALRRASNADAFARRAREVTGEALRILTGAQEARASFRGAVGSLPAFSGRTGVVDVGGGSTEVAAGAGPEPDWEHSFEIGAVRLTERVPQLSGREGSVGERAMADARRIADETLAPLRAQPPVERLLAVGGSVTTGASVSGGGEREPQLSRAMLAALLERLCGLGLEERKRLTGMNPQRADILPAGIIILDAARAMLGQDVAVVAPGDLLLGVLLQERDGGRADFSPEGEL